MTVGPLDLGPLEDRLGHRFADRGLLVRALTHSSYAHEAGDPTLRDNEAFEFLGDAILGFLVADLLHRAAPEASEGLKTKRRAALVAEASLASRARELGLPENLRLGRGEEATGGRGKATLWADAFEAVLAAVYLDGGIEAARTLVERTFAADVAASAYRAVIDFKTTLQERLQNVGRPLPEYRLVSEQGPPHDRVFRVDCVVEGAVVATGEGRSKKQAQQAAAERALAKLAKDDPRM